ncbi:MAG: di-heme oxidoredictase family protein [Parasphingorhabdus sp.]|uniref:di-heme oxidoredictase family protein n=1 Tax=Parasphingorhabdus sp. TaxID=2709688 RepID=UPI00329A0420
MIRFLRKYWFLNVLAFLLIGSSAVASGDNGDGKKIVAEDGFLHQPYLRNSIDGHVRQDDIELGKWTIDQLHQAGRSLFVAQFTRADGAGRPGATGNGSPTRRPLGTGVDFVRTAGPDSNSCVSCHNRPNVGGAGDFVSNVFTGLASRHPVFFSVDAKFSAERDTPELHGAGLIELLAREMTLDLHTIRTRAISEAQATQALTKLPLITKGVEFGHIQAHPDGRVDLSGIVGVDRDLVIRPWTQKGTVTSLRTFTVTSTNLHHGMQATERFGYHLTGSHDFDRDGKSAELTRGDITALVVFQAMMPAPGRMMPNSAKQRERVSRGEQLFKKSKCSSCHMPELPLNSTLFVEPSPFNLEGTLRQSDVAVPLRFQVPYFNQIARKSKPIMIPLFSDLKRHKISDAEKPHFANETMVEGLTSIDEFLTKRLWAVGNTAPFGHRGDITQMREVILHHGGEARKARLEFETLSRNDQNDIILFLSSLQVLPPGSPETVVAPKKPKLPYRKR